MLLSWCPGQSPPAKCDPCAANWVLVQGISEDTHQGTFSATFSPPAPVVPLNGVYFGLGVAPPYNGAAQSGLCFTWYNVDTFSPQFAPPDVPVIYHGVTIWKFSGVGLPEYSNERGSFWGTDNAAHTLTAGQNAVSFSGAVPVGKVWPYASWQDWSIIPYDGPIAFDDAGNPILSISIPTTKIASPNNRNSLLDPSGTGAPISANWNVASPQTIGIFYHCRKS